MKKLLTICLLLATTFTAKAQNMSFEETVKYINEKLACCLDNKDVRLTAKKDGTVSFWGNTFNFFDLEDFTLSNYEKKLTLKTSNGIKVYLDESSGYYGTMFNTSSWSKLLFRDEINAERVYNALLHLRSLCTKTKDPFDK